MNIDAVPESDGARPSAEKAPVLLSVVVRCLNAESTIGLQLEALSCQRTRHTWEVVVVDNGSSDNSLDIVEAYRDRLPRLHVVVKPHPRSRPVAGNVGVETAAGQFIAFADADDVVDGDWVEQLGNALLDYPVAVSRHDYAKLNAGAAGSRDSQSIGPQRAWYPPYYFHAGGCGLGMAKQLFEDMGGFDQEMAVGSDTDLCFKLQRAGYELRFVPRAVVHVRARENPSAAFHQARRWAVMNSKMYRRYRLPGQRLVRPWRSFAKQLRWAIRAAKRARRAGRATDVAWHMGWSAGLILGSLRYLQPPLANDREVIRQLNYREAESQAKDVPAGDTA